LIFRGGAAALSLATPLRFSIRQNKKYRYDQTFSSCAIIYECLQLLKLCVPAQCTPPSNCRIGKPHWHTPSQSYATRRVEVICNATMTWSRLQGTRVFRRLSVLQRYNNNNIIITSSCRVHNIGAADTRSRLEFRFHLILHIIYIYILYARCKRNVRAIIIYIYISVLLLYTLLLSSSSSVFFVYIYVCVCVCVILHRLRHHYY